MINFVKSNGQVDFVFNGYSFKSPSGGTITNPFTGMSINSSVPNPKGCNQWTGPNCKEGSYQAIEREAGIPIEYDSPDPSSYSAPVVGLVMRGLFEELGMRTDPYIKVRKNEPLERAVAMHEVGHHKLGHSQENIPADESLWETKREREAWRWALKNRKKLAVSKKEIRKAIRRAELSGDLPRNTLIRPR